MRATTRSEPALTNDSQLLAAHAKSQYEGGKSLLIAVAVFGVALGTGIGIFVARGIVRGLRRVRTVLQAVADGDLT